MVQVQYSFREGWYWWGGLGLGLRCWAGDSTVYGRDLFLVVAKVPQASWLNSPNLLRKTWSGLGFPLEPLGNVQYVILFVSVLFGAVFPNEFKIVG